MVLKIPKFNFTEKIVYFIFLLIPIVQFLNSFIMYSSGESMFGKLFRFFTLVALLFLCKGKIDNKILILILFLSITCGITVMVDSIRGIEMEAIEWINSILKLLSPIIYYATLNALHRRGKINKRVTHVILVSWSFFLTLSMIIPYFLKIGYYTYEGNGYTGFYYENDSLNIVLCCLMLYILNYAVNKKKKTYYVIVGLLFFTVVLTGSKTSLAYSIISVLYVFLLNKKLNITKLIKRIVLLSSIVIVALVIFNAIEGNVISRQITYYIEVYNWSTTSGGDTPLAVLTNGRTSKAVYCITHLWSSSNILDIFFGIGGYGAEMDFFDTYMKFGLVPILTVVYICFQVKKSCRRHDVYSFALLLILIYAFVAGHVVESSFTCGIISIFVLSLNYKNNNDIDLKG